MTEFDVLLAGGYFCDLIFTGLPEMPRLGAEIYGTDLDVVPGASFTTALALTRLGIRVGWMADFGNDFFSRYVSEEATRVGLDASLFRWHDRPLRRVTAALSFPHERAFVSFVDPLELVDLIAPLHSYHPRWLLLPALMYSEAVQESIRVAHQLGTKVYMDCQQTHATLETPGVIDTLRQVDLFAPNAEEARRLTGAANAPEALSILSQYAPLVIIKHGAEGAITLREGQILRVPALAVTPFDTTGAGDCFNAGFLYGLLQGYSLEDAMRCGTVCGSLSTTARGGAGLPRAEQLEARR